MSDIPIDSSGRSTFSLPLPKGRVAQAELQDYCRQWEESANPIAFGENTWQQIEILLTQVTTRFAKSNGSQPAIDGTTLDGIDYWKLGRNHKTPYDTGDHACLSVDGQLFNPGTGAKGRKSWRGRKSNAQDDYIRRVSCMLITLRQLLC